MNEDKITFNQMMDGYIAAVSTLTQQQIDAIAWVMGGVGAGWNKENITKELQDEKHEEEPDDDGADSRLFPSENPDNSLSKA